MWHWKVMRSRNHSVYSSVSSSVASVASVASGTVCQMALDVATGVAYST
jgi:hypothetical protein